MELNLNNTQPRAVVCHNLPSDMDRQPAEAFRNVEKLKEGNVYHMVRMDVYNWHTDVYLAEFPNLVFNSIFFCEEEDRKLVLILKHLKIVERESRCIFRTVSIREDINLCLIGRYSVKLPKELLLRKLSGDGDLLVFGRSKNCDFPILKNDPNISNVHFYVRKEGENFCIYDCSQFGTCILG